MNPLELTKIQCINLLNVLNDVLVDNASVTDATHLISLSLDEERGILVVDGPTFTIELSN